MMDLVEITPELKVDILNEAIRIGDELLSKAIEENGEIYWECMTLNYAATEPGKSPSTSWSTGDNIYSGTSGIVLFLIELHKSTKEKKYFPYIEKAGKWLRKIVDSSKSNYYAFFTGKCGVAFTLLKIGKLLNDESYIKDALVIAKASEEFLESPTVADDILNGIAGTIVGLLHIHNETGDDTILPVIDKFIDHLLVKTNIGENGLYWDRSNKQVRGLCGFSHGASGVGATFMELAYYFNNPAFYELMHLAFAYENTYYREKQFNWPDFRKSFFEPKDYVAAEEALTKKDMAYFANSGNMSAWCHGAPGIGLARWRAYQLLNDEKYLQDAKNAVYNTASVDLQQPVTGRTFSLCHGIGGNADVFIDGYLITGDEKYLQYAFMAAQKGVELKKNGGIYPAGYSTSTTEEDTSLFMGNAGVGYFYLRCLNPTQSNSITYPVLTNQSKLTDLNENYSCISISKEALRKKLLSKIFPRTIAALEKIDPTYLLELLESKSFGELKNEFNSYVKKGLPKEIRNNVLLESMKLEAEKQMLDESISSAAYLYAKQNSIQEKYNDLENRSIDEFLKIRVEVNKDIKIYTAPMNLSSSVEELLNTPAEEETMYLLIPTYAGVYEWKATQLMEPIIQYTENPLSISELIKKVSEYFGIDETATSGIEKIVSQIKELLKTGVLEFCA